MHDSRRLRIFERPFGVTGEGVPVFLSDGRLLTLALASDAEGARIDLTDCEGSVGVLAEGAPSEIAAAYADICRDLAEKGRPAAAGSRPSALGVVMGAVIGAFAMGTVAFVGIPPSSPPPSAPETTLAEPAAGEASGAEIELLMEMLRRSAAEQPAPGAASGPMLPRSSDLPPFHQVPADLAPAAPPAAAPAAPVPEAADGESESEAEGSFGLPPYGADASQGAEPPAEHADQAAAAREAAGTEPSVQEEDEAPAAAAQPEADEADAPAEAQPDSEDAAQADEEAAGQAGEAASVQEIDPQQAVQEMFARGMTPETAVELLGALEELGREETVTPEMLAQLPHEVAAVLVELGLVEEVAPDGTPYSIIRIPPEVLDAYRGPDGVPSIPERDSWAATGNYVRIPLPGGGDIRTPEDFLEWGLNP